MTKSPRNRASSLIATALVAFGLAQSHGQGTMTITFDNPPLPPNTASLIGSYTESGVRFWYPDPPTSAVGLVLVGAGNAGGSPNNGTTHLETFAGSYLTFGTSPIALFNLISFDATESYNTTPGPETLHVVGYKNDMTAVVIDLTTDGTRQFQTFNLGQTFTGLGRVQITPSSWTGFALDNLVISGVPEPSTGALVLLAAACAFGRSRIKRRRPCRNHPAIEPWR
jgi:hypothetical protein